MVRTTAIQDLGSFNKEVRLMKASALATSPVLCLRCALTMEGEKKLKECDNNNCDTKPITPISVVSPLG